MADFFKAAMDDSIANMDNFYIAKFIYHMVSLLHGSSEILGTP